MIKIVKHTPGEFPELKHSGAVLTTFPLNDLLIFSNMKYRTKSNKYFWIILFYFS